MSPASYLTAPPRVAGCSIARGPSTIAAVLLAVWVALAIAVLAVAGSGVSVGRAALAFRRDLRRFRKALPTDLSDRLERLAERTPARQGDLERSLARLQASLAQL